MTFPFGTSRRYRPFWRGNGSFVRLQGYSIAASRIRADPNVPDFGPILVPGQVLARLSRAVSQARIAVVQVYGE
jgi:hypothetical protein